MPRPGTVLSPGGKSRTDGATATIRDAAREPRVEREIPRPTPLDRGAPHAPTGPMVQMRGEIDPSYIAKRSDKGDGVVLTLDVDQIAHDLRF